MRGALGVLPISGAARPPHNRVLHIMRVMQCTTTQTASTAPGSHEIATGWGLSRRFCVGRVTANPRSPSAMSSAPSWRGSLEGRFGVAASLISVAPSARKQHHRLSYSSDRAVALEDILPSRRNRRHSNRQPGGVKPRGNGRTHGRSGMNR